MASIQQSLNQLTQSFASMGYQLGLGKSFKLAQEKKQEAQAKAKLVEETEKKRQGYLGEIQTSQEAFAARVKTMEDEIKKSRSGFSTDPKKSKTLPLWKEQLEGMLEGERVTADVLRKDYKTNPYAADPRQEPTARVAAAYQRLLDLNEAKKQLKGGAK